MGDRWQIIIAECEKLSDASGVPVPPALYPPAEGQPVGQEWADPWQREARLLDWLTGFLGKVNIALRPAETKGEIQDAGRIVTSKKVKIGD